MRSTLGMFVLLTAAAASAAAAQSTPSRTASAWRIGLSIGTSTFNGAARGAGDTGEELVFVPYRPTMTGVELARGGTGPRLLVSVKYGEPGLGFRGVPEDAEGSPTQGLLIIAEHAFKLTSFTASASIPMARLRGGPILRSSIGLTLERWTAPGTPARTVMGPEAAVALEVALTGGLNATINGALGFTPKSPFRLEDLPEGFSPRSTWRRSLEVGLVLRL
jgi:hypothetical protein